MITWLIKPSAIHSTVVYYHWKEKHSIALTVTEAKAPGDYKVAGGGGRSNKLFVQAREFSEARTMEREKLRVRRDKFASLQ